MFVDGLDQASMTRQTYEATVVATVPTAHMTIVAGARRSSAVP